jgi:hypothetical protein
MIRVVKWRSRKAYLALYMQQQAYIMIHNDDVTFPYPSPDISFMGLVLYRVPVDAVLLPDGAPRDEDGDGREAGS